MRESTYPTRGSEQVDPQDMSRESVVRRALAARPRPGPRFTSGGLYLAVNGNTQNPAGGVFVIPGSNTTVLAAGSDPVFTLNAVGNNELKYNGWPQLMRATLKGTFRRSTGGNPGNEVFFVGTGKRNGSVPVNGDQVEISHYTSYRQGVYYPFQHSHLYEVRDGDVIAPLLATFLVSRTWDVTGLQMWCETVKELTV